MEKKELKSILFIFSKPPYSGLAAKEALDAVIASSIFDIPMACVFIDDGVFLLTSGHETSEIDAKSIEKPLSALEMYGVDKLYVHSSSLQQRGIETKPQSLPMIQVDDQRFKSLLSEYDCVLNF